VKDKPELLAIENNRRATEKFVARNCQGHKSFYYADEDGFMEGQISRQDQITVIIVIKFLDTVLAGGNRDEYKSTRSIQIFNLVGESFMIDLMNTKSSV